MFINGSGRNEQSLYRTFHRCFLPCFGSFGQAVSEEKNLKNQPIRNKSRLWQSCLLTDRDKMSILYRGSSIDASYQVSVHLAEGFQRRRLKCEKLTDDRRRTPSDDKRLHCLWQGELKRVVLKNNKFNNENCSWKNKLICLHLCIGSLLFNITQNSRHYFITIDRTWIYYFDIVPSVCGLSINYLNHHSFNYNITFLRSVWRMYITHVR